MSEFLSHCVRIHLLYHIPKLGTRYSLRYSHVLCCISTRHLLQCLKSYTPASTMTYNRCHHCMHKKSTPPVVVVMKPVLVVMEPVVVVMEPALANKRSCQVDISRPIFDT